MCNGCNGVSLGDHGVPEGDRIPSLKSHGKALEQPNRKVVSLVLLLLLLLKTLSQKASRHGTDKIKTVKRVTSVTAV